MKKLITAVLLAASFMAGANYTANAYDYHQKQERYIEKLQKELNLTQDQVEKIKQIKQAQREEMKEFMKQHKNPVLEATKNGNFDKEAFKNTVVENAKNMAEIRAKYLEKMFSVLNEDQKKKFIEIMKERVDRMHEKMHKEF
ncbi:Spy/CpxP family protein refolding chaperone [Sulfurihydrogenibium azorense]|jgi:Spy/CpxP family protein refolding chaperone|uniref:Spy/CpxP family protein refolding chaperone n=1 Tax=Sulfurihydrogenibium azorense TaxID=309806 RepID=UPI00240A316B|nr:Spy/CpxP family protein refolding chaperone [Sulfurihydrogenibium azorense]MDM7274058.1 Spy/CpxP family protein refolding chaperone [Sulfurihydrogenibium azorense]